MLAEETCETVRIRFGRRLVRARMPEERVVTAQGLLGQDEQARLLRPRYAPGAAATRGPLGALHGVRREHGGRPRQERGTFWLLRFF